MQGMEVTRKDLEEKKPEAEPVPPTMAPLPPAEPEPQPQQGPVPMVVDEETADKETEGQPAAPMMQEAVEEVEKEKEPAASAPREGHEVKEGGEVVMESTPAAVPQEGSSERKEDEEGAPAVQNGQGGEKDKEEVQPQKPEEIESLLEGSSEEDKAVIMGLFGLHQDSKASEYRWVWEGVSFLTVSSVFP